MLAIGYSTLKRSSALGIVTVLALSGCTSVEYTPQHQLAANQTVTPAAKPQIVAGPAPAAAAQQAQTAANTAVATPVMASTVVKKSARVGNAQLIQFEAQPAAAQPAESARTALVATAGQASASEAIAAAAPQQTGAEAMSVSYAEMPLTDEVTAIQSVVPTRRPDHPFGQDVVGPQLAYAAAMPAAPRTVRSMNSMTDFDTRPLSEIESRMAPMPKESEMFTGGPQINNSMMKKLISKYAALYKVPEDLVHRVVRRESTYNPKAYAHGNYGLMQIRYNTAKAMGYSGPASGLFDAETNLKYAVKYLRGAFVTANNDHDSAVRLYASGYYYTAKRKGLLNQLQ